jgi:hypothetical protein
VSDLPFSFLSRPCDEVEPIATRARELPALRPAYAAAYSFAYSLGPTERPAASNCGDRKSCRFDSFQTE